MELVQAAVLGVIQGVAEFLPISSSGHLAVIPEILGWQEFAGNVAFDVLLHVGTLVAVFAYFREDLRRMVVSAFSSDPEKASDRRIGWLVVAATFVTGVIGLAFDDFFSSFFSEILWIGVFLLCTSAILTLAEWLSTKATHSTEGMSFGRACLVGLAQGLAIMPGISRSGATISMGLVVGLDREQSARFSFLLSAPIILLASGKTAYDAATHGVESFPGLSASLVGFAASAIAGYFSIAWLVSYLKNRSLYPFAVYTGVAGIGVIVWKLFFA